jgi:ankyrin repeat protein
MNLKTSAIYIMLVGLTMALEGMKKEKSGDKPAVSYKVQMPVGQTTQIGNLKDAIANRNLSRVNSLLPNIEARWLDNILFSLKGQAEIDIQIFDAIMAALGSDCQRVVNFKNPNQQGQTMLHHATQQGWVAIVDKLIAAGAQMNVVSQAGKTPLALAVARYCLLYKGTTETLKNGAQQIVELLKEHVILSTIEYERDVQSIVVKDFSPEPSGKKSPLPAFLRMETFTLAKRDVHQAPVAVSVKPAEMPDTQANGISNEKNKGVQPPLPSNTPIVQTQHATTPVPVPQAPPVPNNNQQNNPAPSMLTAQNKYILVFGACVLAVFAAYAWLYQDEIEDDAQQKQDQDENQSAADVKNQSL